MYLKVSILAFVPKSFAAVQTVIAGANDQLTFTPKIIQAAPIDQVQFLFQSAIRPFPQSPRPRTNPRAENHTVTSGDATQGCVPDSKFYSGFVAGPPHNNADPANLPNFTVEVADASPQAGYCSQAQHCQSRMVMLINPAGAGTASLGGLPAARQPGAGQRRLRDAAARWRSAAVEAEGPRREGKGRGGGNRARSAAHFVA